MVVYTADQGYWLGQHGFYDKRLILEESLRMPLLIRFPSRVKPGSVCDKLVMNIDFAETFLDYAGVSVPAAMQGRWRSENCELCENCSCFSSSRLGTSGAAG